MNRLFKGIIIGLRYVKNNEFRKWVNGYGKPTSIIFERKGNGGYGQIIYYIGMEDLGGNEKNMGFFALFNCVLNRLYYADRLGLIPYVRYPNTVLYFDHQKGDNVWEYYFQPVSDIGYEDVTGACNLVVSKEKDSQFNLKEKSGYELDDDGVKNLAYIMKKYIHINTNMQEYLQTGLELLGFKNKLGGVLGVHIRGTDFNRRNKNHPIAVELNEYIDRIKELLQKSKYNYIFLATDEDNVVKRVKEIFGQKRVFYYCDTIRSGDGLPVHKSDSKRRNHKFLLGCEVLRDVYTLARCNGFVAGRSQVSLAVQILKKSWDGEWRDLQIIDKGMYQ